jgi:DUF4097 and DUF4098 domain-containing protein YvlB
VIHEHFEVDSSPDIEVRIESGRVEVRQGEPGNVDVEVDTEAPNFIVEQRGNSILVSSDKSTSWLSRGSAYVVIDAPEGSDLRVNVASAQIQADLPLQRVDLKSASGDIELRSVETLTAKTASGDMRVERTGRALRFSSASGDLLVEEAANGSVSVSTASGDIMINDCDATIDINSVSGDVRLRRFTGRSASFKAMSGSIDLGIPRRSEVSLDANLLSGSLRLPEPDTSDEEPDRQMSIKVKLVSGDLRITRTE